MSKKKIIIETIGVVLEEQGFTYGLDKWYKDPWNWGFTREVNGIKQMVVIGKSRFEKIVGIGFITTVWGRRGLTEETRRAIEGKEPGSHPYETDEDFKEIMIKFAKYTKEWGVKILEELSVEEEILPTLEMADKLMASYEELSDEFIRKNQIDVLDRSKENISEWFKVIDTKIIETKDEPYEKVQEMLVEIAAFVGEQLRKDVGGEWEQPETAPRAIFVKGMNTFLQKGIGVLGQIVEAWKNQSIKRMKQNYFFILDGKLPLTMEQMVEYQANTEKYFI